MRVATLTAKRRKFVEVYAGNGTEAARLAGFEGNDATLGQTAYRLLRNAEIQAALKARETKEVRPLIASRQDRQKFWTSTMQDTDCDYHVRLKASELLGRSEADFTDKLAGADGGPLEIVVRKYSEGEE